MARRTYIDFDGNGRADIPWRYFSSGSTGLDHFAYWQNQLNGFAWQYVGGYGSTWDWLPAGDFSNDDASSDVLFWNVQTDQVGFWDVNNGQIERWVTLGYTNRDWNVYGTADFTGDGTDDVLFSDLGQINWGFWDVDNGAVSSWNSLGVSGVNWSPGGLGDFTGDGRADVFWHNDINGATGLWRTQAGAPAAWVGLPTVAEEWRPSVGSGEDLNGDGNGDVLWVNTVTNAIGFWDLDSGSAQWTYIGAAASGWSQWNVGDYTGDGTADILFKNTSTGDIGYWELDVGGVYAGWVYVGRDLPGDGWTVW